MKKFIKIRLLLVIILIFSCKGISAAEFNVDYVWNATVKELLKDSLWNSKNIYDAGHFLMIPLHASFKLNKLDWQVQFKNHFNNFYRNKDSIYNSRLHKLHYYYLISQFLILSKKNEINKTLCDSLFQYLYKDIINIWSIEKAWQWKHKNHMDGFFDSMEERIEWKLTNTVVEEKTFHRAIIDEELFTIAIASDLKYYLILNQKDTSNRLSNIVSYADKIFRRRVEFNSFGGWIFQKGIWFNHRDYVYAGNNDYHSNIEKKPIETIAMDVSHFHRMPLWLQSLISVNFYNEENKYYYEILLKKLNKQLFTKVLKKPSDGFCLYRTKNYMDGNNGVYRYEFITLGDNNGYGPYELTYQFLLGWWTFIDSKEIKEVYGELYKCFPLKGKDLDLVKIKSNRTRNEIISNSNENGLRQLLCYLASEI